MPDASMPTCHYYVDEAGDTTLFNARGRAIIGTEGCSRYFILGLLRVENPVLLDSKLSDLRENLLKDPYFRDVPSMSLSRQKTAQAFHAKDDIPEVRREVFALLNAHQGLSFAAVVRDKHAVLREVETYRNKRYTQNTLYDQLVPCLFKGRLHKESEYQITFATRGKSDRTQALRSALTTAQERFEKQWQISSTASTEVLAVPSKQSPCLQAADYFLWSLQRCYERREDRYLVYLWDHISVIHDIDDTRERNYGKYYKGKNRIAAAGLPDFNFHQRI